jgi:eukaryotic-like serine/threonine-protein kinase
MKSKRIIIVSSLLIIVSIILSACSSTVYASTSWHGLTIGPASAPDTAYLAAGTQVYAVDLKTGTQKWKYPAKPNAKGFYASPVLSEDGKNLIVPGYDHKLYNVNPTTGVDNWQSDSIPDLHNRLIASPLIIGNTIYQPSADGNVYAINMTTGSEIWSIPATTGTDPLWAQPVTFQGCNCIYIAAMNHKVYKFDATSGAKINETNDLNGSVVGTPAIGTDGTLYVGTFANELIALSGDNLSVKWRFSTKDWVWAGPALDKGVLYFGDLSGNLYAVNAADGTQVWSVQPKNTIVDTPAIAGDNIYLSTESDTLYIVSKAGEIADSVAIGGIIYAAPKITSDMILVAPTGYDKNLLVALNLENPHGALMWPAFVPPK